MSEKIRPLKNNDIATIGLTQVDIDSRGVVAVGYCERELLPPYKSADHETRARAVLDYLSSARKSITSSSSYNIEDVDLLASFPDTKVIQVVGGLANFCIPKAVDEIISAGLYSFIDSRLIFADSPYSDLRLGAMVMRDVMNYYSGKCLVTERSKFIYYKG